MIKIVVIAVLFRYGFDTTLNKKIYQDFSHSVTVFFSLISLFITSKYCYILLAMSINFLMFISV